MKTENSRYVLDSFALLCFLDDDPGANDIQALLESARTQNCELFMNVVNLSEVYYTTKRRNGGEQASQVLSLIDSFPMTFENADRALALLAGDIKAKAAISLADCFCAASAKRRSATVVTGDPEFEEIEGEIKIKWLPRKPRKGRAG